MNDLIQVIKILDTKDLKIINEHIDTLTFKPNTVFGTGGKNKVAKYWRTSTGTSLNDNDDVTCIFHRIYHHTFHKTLPRSFLLNIPFHAEYIL